MQVFKRVEFNKKNAQNLIEFSFVLPLLIFLTLCIFEVALFWQDVNAIYSLNTEINANAALIDPRTMALGTTCTSATNALNTLKAKAATISLDSNATYSINPEPDSSGNAGHEPFSLYKITSSDSVSVNYFDSTGKKTTGASPRVTMWVDCTNPFENGVTTQVQFYHKTLVMQASIPRFDKAEPIVIIPSNILIASPKLNTIRHY